MDKLQLLRLLRSDVVPALGCTEPVCVALCAACAAKVLDGPIRSAEILVNPGIYKNGMSAGIPNCREVGLDRAAAIGACLKNPEKSLQLLEDVTPELLEAAMTLIRENRVCVRMDHGQTGLFVRCALRSDTCRTLCIIRDAHTNVVCLEKDGRVLFEAAANTQSGGEDPTVCRLKETTLSRLRELVETCTEEELDFLMEGVEMNEALADHSRSRAAGVGIADTLRGHLGSSLFANDLMNRILTKVASAAESRLDGCPLPTMSSSGAGTKGLVVILPISETAAALGASRLQTLQALAFGHLVNRYINAHIGKLAPMCSCVMAASTAAAAGITWLLGGNDAQIGHAVRNMSGTVTGMICDGGKVGCALKVATGSAAALLCALTAANGAALRVSDGICAETPEDCIRNMARIGTRAMAGADAEILNIMCQKQQNTSV